MIRCAAGCYTPVQKFTHKQYINPFGRKNTVLIIFFTNTKRLNILFQFFAGFLNGQRTDRKTDRRSNQNRLCDICGSPLTGCAAKIKLALYSAQGD